MNIHTMWFDYVLSCLIENLQLYWCYSFSTSVRWTPVDVPYCALWYCFDSFLRDFRDFVSWTKQMQSLIVLVLVIFCNLAGSSHTCLRNPKKKKIFIRIIVILSVFSRGCCFYILSYNTHLHTAYCYCKIWQIYMGLFSHCMRKVITTESGIKQHITGFTAKYKLKKVNK